MDEGITVVLTSDEVTNNGTLALRDLLTTKGLDVTKPMHPPRQSVDLSWTFRGYRVQGVQPCSSSSSSSS